jgi:ligand-binding sensor domain-containing protein
MSDSFIRGLEHDLVEAMERFEKRRQRRWLAYAPHPRLPRGATLARVAATAAIVIAVVIAARDLTLSPPPTRPHVVAVVPIGGAPMDAVFADGSLWVTDFRGSLVQVDPRDRRVTARIKLPGAPEPVAVSADSVWAQTAGKHCEGELVRIDAGSGRIVARRSWPYPSEQPGALAAGGDSVWIERGCVTGNEGVDRLDQSGGVTAHVSLRSVDGLAAAPGNLWVLGHDGTVTQIDATGGRVRQRWPGLAPLSDPNTWGTKALVADRDGLWVLSTGRAAILHLEHGRIAQQIAVDASVRPLLAKAQDGLWIATADRGGTDNRLVRLDPDTGRRTATLKLRDQRPIALVSTDGPLYVVTSNGKILVIRS